MREVISLALLGIALACAEVAVLGIAFAWVFIPGIEDMVVWPIWMAGSMLTGPIGAFWVGHWILSRASKPDA